MSATTTSGLVLISPVRLGFRSFSGCVDRTFKHYANWLEAKFNMAAGRDEIMTENLK